ncbi:MAG: hypothetical protein CSA62_03195 [Planctomycetota bacterium]|nr:MAG: hypothetical protein CSA62_03195 [Planctomycetota bacterium]
MASAPDKMPLGQLAVYTFAGGGLIWVVFLAVQLLYFSRRDALIEERVYKNIDRPVQVMQREQRLTLKKLRWVDKEKKRVAIPIERAKRDVLKIWKKD